MRPASVIFACTVTLLLAAAASAQPQRTVRFSGYDWEVRQTGKGGPGPNQWDPANVRVDKNGWLHLNITKVRNEWRCAELSTTKRLGFGRYEFQVMGRIDRFDPTVVLGLFNYTTPDIGPDGTNEIDIEIARWGNPKWDNGSFTIYPSKGERITQDDHHTFAFALTGDDTTQRFAWSGSQVAFEVLQGRGGGASEPLAGAQWVYAPHDLRLIPQQPLPVHINLWLFRGKPPADQKGIEVVVKQFTFVPLHLLR